LDGSSRDRKRKKKIKQWKIVKEEKKEEEEEEEETVKGIKRGETERTLSFSSD
jgi:hypothetical protein